MMGQWTTQIFALTTWQQKYVETGILATDHAKISRFFSLLELESQQWKQLMLSNASDHLIKPTFSSARGISKMKKS